MKNQKRVYTINNLCWDIFNEHGGYNFNDEMLTQLEGLSDSISECMNDDDWEHMLKEANTTHAWFDWVKSIRVLEDNEPKSLYC